MRDGGQLKVLEAILVVLAFFLAFFFLVALVIVLKLEEIRDLLEAL